MNLPNTLITCISLLVFSTDSKAQRNPPCTEVKVEMKVEFENPSLPNTNRVVLEFESEDYRDFKLFLFSGNQSDNRLDLTATEIESLPKGNYTLVIQGRDEKKFCPKQFKFKIK